MNISNKRINILAALTIFVFATFISYTPVNAESLCTIPDPEDAKVCYDDFYSGNNILYYDPNASACDAMTVTPASSSGPLVGNSNAEKIFTYLTGKGLSAEQAAGVLGNFQQESGFDPAIIQGGAIAGANYTPVNGIGFGIAQWTFTARQAPLVNLARSSGRSVIDLSLQLDFLWQELNTTHARSLTTLKEATTPERAAYVFHRDFEGSADSESFVLLVRGGNARKLYEQYKNLAPGSTTVTPVSSTSADCPTATTGAGSGTGSTNFMSDSFTIYNQCQYPPYGGPWGTMRTTYGFTMCAAACGPTALAMISRNMNGSNITPMETINYYTENKLWFVGGGSLISSLGKAAGAFGLTATPITNKGDVAAYKEVFDKGGLISVSARGTSPFLSYGHTIVLRGITPEGNFMIADPGYKETNIAPANQINVNKILTDVRNDSSSVSYAYFKK